MIARPRATSSLTSSGSTPSRTAQNSISAVIIPLRAYAIWVTAAAPRARSGSERAPVKPGTEPFRPSYSSTSPRSRIQ